MSNKVWKGFICIFVPTIIILFPTPPGLTTDAWKLFAIYIGSILGLMLCPVSEAIVLLTALSISGLTLHNLDIVMSGYSNSVTWLVFAAFSVGTAFVETGLGRRIAYLLIGIAGRTPLRLGYVAAITDLILSPATPSVLARTGGIVYPIFRSVAVTLGSEPGPTSRKIGAYLSVLLYQISLTTGYIFLTALSVNALMTTFAKQILNVKLDWITWFKAAAVPGMVMLVLIPWIVYKLYPPEIKEIDNKALAEKGLVEIGSMSWREKALGALFILAVIGWATTNITNIDPTTVAISFLAALLLTGVVSWESILKAKGAWTIFIWYGGIVGLANAMARVKFFEWVAKTLSDNVSFVGYNSIVILGLIIFGSLVVRYLFASVAGFVTTMMPVMFTIGLVAQVPLVPLALLSCFAAAYGGLITHFGGAVGPVLFAPGYVDQVTWWKIGAIITIISFVVHMTIGLSYWKFIGLW